jgi:hypothetical protein
MLPQCGPQAFLVFDCKGYHCVALDYCGCKCRNPCEQLLEVGWYPALVDRPRTAFMFSFLDMFERITMQGKITLHDYYLSVVHKTNNAGTLPPVVQ